MPVCLKKRRQRIYLSSLMVIIDHYMNSSAVELLNINQNVKGSIPFSRARMDNPMGSGSTPVNSEYYISELVISP